MRPCPPPPKSTLGLDAAVGDQLIRAPAAQSSWLAPEPGAGGLCKALDSGFGPWQGSGHQVLLPASPLVAELQEKISTLLGEKKELSLQVQELQGETRALREQVSGQDAEPQRLVPSPPLPPRPLLDGFQPLGAGRGPWKLLARL